MGSVRSDHVGQRCAESLAAATSCAGPAAARADRSSRPASLQQPARGLRGWVEGGDLRGGTWGQGGPSRPPLHCGARGWGVQRSRPLRGGR